MVHSMHGGMTSGVVSWSTHSANLPAIADEDAADTDEPPDSKMPYSPIKAPFTRNPIRRSIDLQQHQSLLTKALQSHPEDDNVDAHDLARAGKLRRPTFSNASLASTADLTSDTGLTSPSRTNTPSPPLPELRFLNLNGTQITDSKQPQEQQKKTAPPKKRCIQFACAARPDKKIEEKLAPERPVLPQKTPSAGEPRKTCIKFACPSPRPASTQNTPPAPVARLEAAASKLEASASGRAGAAATIRKYRNSSHSRSPRSSMARRSSREASRKPAQPRKYITASDRELQNESSRFHEFASDEHCDEDWIRESYTSRGRKLTINDTLSKENEIRKIATEAEEEAEQEEEEELETTKDDDDDDDDDDEDDLDNTPNIVIDEDELDDDDDDDDLDDGLSGYVTEEEDSVGYHTDEETGFAASDDEEDDGLQLWTPAQPALRLSGSTPVPRQQAASIGPNSYSSIGSMSSVRAVRSGKARRIKIRPGTPELPDSTDFVCGTLDEDRPMEDAYMSCLAARRAKKQFLIPQDIDPSFPASEPEEEGEEQLYNPVKHASDDEEDWLHGQMEDLHHEQDKRGRKKKGPQHSPKRLHSPPPPKARGRSPAPPKRLFDRRSPPRLRSPPPPQLLESPPASLRTGPRAVPYKELASRPGLTMTKSLPRPPALFANLRQGRRKPAALSTDSDVHVRGAIDIVKGLERKRQRRKEKFHQKYCNRARKGQIPERKPLPGMGCERMRELGLLMAGKIDQGNYVLSV